MNIKNFKRNIIISLCITLFGIQLSACAIKKEEKVIDLPDEEVLSLNEDSLVSDIYTYTSHSLPKLSNNDALLFYTEKDDKAYYTRHELAHMSNSAKKAEIGFIQNTISSPEPIVLTDDDSKYFWYQELNLLDNQLVWLNHTQDKYQIESVPNNGGDIKTITTLANSASISVIDGLIFVYEIKDDKVSINSIDPKTQEIKKITNNVHLITPYDRISWEDSNHACWFEKEDNEIFLVYKEANEMKKIKMNTDAVTSLAFHGDYLTWMELPEKTSWVNKKIHALNTKTMKHKSLKLPDSSNFVSLGEKIYLSILKTNESNDTCTLFEWDLASNEISAIHKIKDAQFIVNFPKVFGNGNILINYEKNGNFAADFLNLK